MNKIIWRPVTNCCWHAFYLFKNSASNSLCEKETISSNENDKIHRPPILYRCVSCLEMEKAGRDRNLPATEGWKELMKETDAPEIEDDKVVP